MKKVFGKLQFKNDAHMPVILCPDNNNLPF